METQVEVKNSEYSSKVVSKNRDRLLNELQGLTDTLEELYRQNVRLNNENALLKNEVRVLRSHTDNILDSMKQLQEDLRKAYDIIRETREKPKIELLA